MPVAKPSLPVLLPAILLLSLAAASAQSTVSPSDQPVVRDAQLGVNIHLFPGWVTQDVIPLLAESGVAWVRDDLPWKWLEKTRGVYEIPPAIRADIDALHAAGLKIDLILDYGNTLYAPDSYNPEAYANAAAYLAKTLTGKIDAIEILNEPANFGYSKCYGGTWNGIEKDGSVSPWVGKYVELINKAAKAIKLANPAMKVVGLGSAAPVNFRQLEMGIAPAVVGLVDHPYSYRTPPEIVPYASSPGILKRDGIATADDRGTFASQIRMYQEQTRKFHGPKEIWLTEFGWSTYQESKGGMLYAGFTESAKTKYILRRLVEAFGLGVDIAMIYDFVDDGVDPYNVEHHFGLVDKDLHPKPSFYALRRFAAAMADFRPHQNFKFNAYAVANRPDTRPITWDGSLLESTGKIASYQFADSSGKPLVAIWSTERADGDLNPVLATVEMVTDEPIASIEAYDIYNDFHYEIPFEKKEGKIVLKKIQIPDSPLLLTLSLTPDANAAQP